MAPGPVGYVFVVDVKSLLVSPSLFFPPSAIQSNPIQTRNMQRSVEEDDDDDKNERVSDRQRRTRRIEANFSIPFGLASPLPASWGGLHRLGWRNGKGERIDQQREREEKPSGSAFSFHF